MNAEKLKTLDKIATDLRANGELDEEKWKKYIDSRDWRHIFFFILTSALGIFTFFIKGTVIFFVSVAICVILWWWVVQSLKNLYLLYTIGQRTVAIVIDSSLIRIGSGINNYRLVCKFYNDDKKYIIRFQNNLSQNTKESRPTVGDKIDIIYLEFNPKITTRYLENNEQKYNLRKI